jgi:hypothetical protein
MINDHALGSRYKSAESILDYMDQRVPRSSVPMPMLIPLPTVRRKLHRARRPSAAATAWVRENGLTHRRLKPRRRLRREVRMVGHGLIMAASFAVASVLLQGAATPTTTDWDEQPARIATAVRPPVVSISIDASSLVPAAEPPAVLQGYLLPDDRAEESKDAGG